MKSFVGFSWTAIVFASLLNPLYAVNSGQPSPGKVWRCALLLEDIFLARSFDQSSEKIRHSFRDRIDLLRADRTGRNLKPSDLERTINQAMAFHSETDADRKLVFETLTAVTEFILNHLEDPRVVTPSRRHDFLTATVVRTVTYFSSQLHVSHSVDIRKASVDSLFKLLNLLPTEGFKWTATTKFYWEKEDGARSLTDVVISTLFFDEWTLVHEDSDNRTEEWRNSPWMKEALPYVLSKFEELLSARSDLRTEKWNSMLSKFNNSMSSSRYRGEPSIERFHRELLAKFKV